MTPLSKRPGPNLPLSLRFSAPAFSQNISAASFRRNVWMGEFRKTCDLWAASSLQTLGSPGHWVNTGAEYSRSFFSLLLSNNSQETPFPPPTLRQTLPCPLASDSQPAPRARSGIESIHDSIAMLCSLASKYTLSHSETQSTITRSVGA